MIAIVLPHIFQSNKNIEQTAFHVSSETEIELHEIELDVSFLLKGS